MFGRIDNGDAEALLSSTAGGPDNGDVPGAATATEDAVSRFCSFKGDSSFDTLIIEESGRFAAADFGRSCLNGHVSPCEQ
jgi:hypothetical protein